MLKTIQSICHILGAVAGDETGNLWNVCILKFGLSADGRLDFKRANMTAAEVAKFEGAKLFALRTGQHQDAAKHGKPPVDIIGVVTKPETRDDGIYGQVIFLPTGYGIRDNLKAARDMGVPDPYGLSVDIDGKASKSKVRGKEVLSLLSINQVSVDVVYDPAAGGQFLQMAAAAEAGHEEAEMFQKLLAALQGTRPDLVVKITAAIEAGTMTEDEALTQIAAATVKDAGGDAGNTDLVAKITAALQQLVATPGADNGANKETQILACEIRLERALVGSGLPVTAQDHIRKNFDGKIFAAVELDNMIKSTKEMLDSAIAGTGLVIEAGQIRAAIVADQHDKHIKMFDDFFDGKVMSFKACYQDFTGDMLVTGQLRDAVKMQASIATGGFTEMLGDSITRRMVSEYNASGLDDWRKICDTPVPLNDFRTNRRPRLGGYGDLPAVAQGAAYGALTSPADEESTYAATKRGGTEDITLEAIKNDDVGLVRRVPVRLGRAAARTLYKFVFAFLDSNAAIYDAVALFHATHSNLAVAALAKATLQANRLAMWKQQEQGSAEPLGIAPKSLIVPLDLADAAYELTVQPNLAGIGTFTPTASSAVWNQTWELIVCKTWSDTNNWYTMADPKDIPTIEIGFLDGKQDPELFVQDLPTVGSMFSNDKLTYKIRHIYGGAVIDYRGIQGNVVP
jgi:hypothetical protein